MADPHETRDVPDSRQLRPRPSRNPSDSLLEHSLYDPILEAVKQRFAESGNCVIEVTADGLSDEVKRILPERSMYMLLQEKKRPDMIGEARGVIGITKKRFVVEVKTGVLTFDDIYQVKLYAEMLNTDEALLISPAGMNQERLVFLRDNPHMLSYGTGYHHITILTYDIERKQLAFLRELGQSDPFSFRL